MLIVMKLGWAPPSPLVAKQNQVNIWGDSRTGRQRYSGGLLFNFVVVDIIYFLNSLYFKTNEIVWTEFYASKTKQKGKKCV